MKKISFINSRDEKLNGIIHNPNNGSDFAIITCHGFSSNKDTPRLSKISQNLAKKSFTVLRFDFSGCGNSQGKEVLIKNYIDDLESASRCLKTFGYKNFGLIGESLGGLICLKSNISNLLTIVLISPVTNSTTPSSLRDPYNQKELEEKGYISFARHNKIYRLTKQFYDERKNINQKKMLNKIQCPVLILHGNEDETVPIQDSRNAINHLAPGSMLQIIPRGKHHLDENIDYVSKRVLNWFCKN